MWRMMKRRLNSDQKKIIQQKVYCKYAKLDDIKVISTLDIYVYNLLCYTGKIQHNSGSSREI